MLASSVEPHSSVANAWSELSQGKPDRKCKRHGTVVHKSRGLLARQRISACTIHGLHANARLQPALFSACNSSAASLWPQHCSAAHKLHTAALRRAGQRSAAPRLLSLRSTALGAGRAARIAGRP